MGHQAEQDGQQVQGARGQGRGRRWGQLGNGWKNATARLQGRPQTLSHSGS